MVHRTLKNKYIRKRLFALAFLIGLAVIIYIYHPATPVRMIRCPFREITGLNCPGCGSIRAMTQIIQGNWLRAAHHNVLAVLFLPLLIWLVLSNILLVATGKSLPFPQLPSKAIWFILALFVIFAVLRNLPLAQLDFLGP